MSKRETPDTERAAMVIHRRDGRWEVQVSDSEGADGARRWRHRKMFGTEQEAEQFARSILPYCDVAWDRRLAVYSDVSGESIKVRQPEKSRKPRHVSEA